MMRLHAYLAAHLRLAARDSGAALVTVLLIVSVMAAGAAITFDALGYTIKRTTARRMFDQARYFAIGGEQLVVATAETINKNKVRLTEPQSISYPIEGGRIDGVIEDASNCFNVNSLVTSGDADGYRVNEDMAVQYQRLLTNIGLAERESRQLAATLIDWLDSDSRPVTLGAEDYDYTNLNPPYRTANTLMADLTELAMVQGYNADILAVVRPHLCLLDSTRASVFNVNTLRPQNAPLLAALVGEGLDVSRAAEVIASRPSSGYQEVGEFWQETGLRAPNVPQGTRMQTDVKATLLRSRIRVTYYEAVSHVTSFVYVDTSGVGRLVGHQFGVVP